MKHYPQQKVPTIGEFRELLICIAISSGSIKSADLYEYCSKWGLKEGTLAEVYASKKNYIVCRLPSVEDKEKLIDVARRVVQDFPSWELEDAIYNLSTPQELLISPITRHDILKVLDEVDPLFGELELFSCLQILNSDLISSTVDIFGVSEMTALMKDIQQHYQNNDDYTNEQLLLHCGAIECAQNRFFALLEKLTRPEVRKGEEQKHLVKKINNILNRENYELTVSHRDAGIYDVYTVTKKQFGKKTRPKNIIFAATNMKPDLVLEDAINNDISIKNAHETDALIYDFTLTNSGLLWDELVLWWSKKNADQDFKESQSKLYDHLINSVKKTKSPCEYALFIVYYHYFRGKLQGKLPALLPQVYLHYDHKTIRQRGAEKSFSCFRMDFLMLLKNNIRIVIEIDGVHHYADNGKPSPQKYAEMVQEDRRLRLNGYEVFRFGTTEFSDIKLDCGYNDIHPKTNSMIVNFFSLLFKKYDVMESASQ